MGKPYSDDLRDRVVAAMAGGRSCRDVGAVFHVAPSTAGKNNRSIAEVPWLGSSARPSSAEPPTIANAAT